MRTKYDTKNRSTQRKKSKRFPGGKVLQRLFAYLGERDPRLSDEVVTTLAVTKAARPTYGPTKKARGPRRPSAKPFADAIGKAAAALTQSSRRTRLVSPKAKKAAALTTTPPASWQPIGPSRIPKGQTYGTNTIDVIGRVSSIAVDPSDPKHLLVGAAGGGIWESKNTGATWAPRTDQLPSLAIGAIEFDPASPNRVYAGSGEGNFYSNLGAGVYKSTDGGTTWVVLASAPFVGVGFYDLVVDPATSSILYAATTNGFYKSTDSGTSWSLKQGGPCWDVSVHPSGGSTEILATFGNGLFVSTNAGNTFTSAALPSGPSGVWDRLAVDHAHSQPDIAYAFGAVGNVPYLWSRNGGTWKKITSLPAIDANNPWTGQAWYDWYVKATPNIPSQVYLGTIDAFRGTISGSTASWTNISTQGSHSIHPDQHCLTFSPNNPKVIYAGSDGGIFRSANGGATWKALNNGLGITEVEYLAGDPSTSKWLMAGTQDNGTIRYTGSLQWDAIAGGDGGDCGVNQLNPDVIYHSFYKVSLERSPDKGNSWTDLGLPWPPAYASLFYPPIEVFGSTVAIGAASLLVTRSGAQPWTPVAIGLGAREVPTAMREIDANTILVGTNIGRMLKVSWNGTSWSKVSLTSPASRYISCIAVDPSNPQRIWVTMSQVGGGMVYRSDNAGSTWADCTAGLPKISMNAVVVDPANFQRVWVAADMGVYQTLDLGSSWAAFSTGLPNAMAADLLFHKQDRMLICATRSRGVWVIAVP
jgi:photosystem II stability/assembly factor-like uncharacterized protein